MDYQIPFGTGHQPLTLPDDLSAELLQSGAAENLVDLDEDATVQAAYATARAAKGPDAYVVLIPDGVSVLVGGKSRRNAVNAISAAYSGTVQSTVIKTLLKVF